MTRSPDQVYNELLVLRAQSGEEAAFQALFLRWNRSVIRYAVRLTECEDAADDIAQETWLAIAHGIGRLNDPACFPRWVMQIASRKSADWIRRKKRRRALNQQMAHDRGVADPVSASPPVDCGDEMRDAIQRLSGDQRALLSMVYLDGMPLSEIAEILRLPVGTIKSRLHYTRAQLKTILERKMP